MINPRLIDVLRKMAARLDEASVNWALVGSFGFAVRGATIEHNDIDVMTTKEGAYKIERVFSEVVTRMVALRISDNIQSHLGALEIDGVKVEIMGDLRLRRSDGGWADPPNMTALTQRIRFEEMHIPVLDLEWERRSYTRLGRTERVEVIEELTKRAPSPRS